MTVRNSVHSLYRTDGFRAFYRGLTASYAGTLETAIHFVIYERLKLQCMVIAATSKMTASCLCYPHGVLLSAMFLKAFDSLVCLCRGV